MITFVTWIVERESYARRLGLNRPRLLAVRLPADEMRGQILRLAETMREGNKP